MMFLHVTTTLQARRNTFMGSGIYAAATSDEVADGFMASIIRAGDSKKFFIS